MTENSENPETESMTILEAILFAASGPVSYSQLAAVLEIKPAETRALAQKLASALVEQNRGIRLLIHDDKVQLTTSPETADFVEKFLGIESAQKLTRAAQEALTIVAYKQPVSRPAIDAIRGVNSDGVLRGLLSRGLIEEVARADTPGRPLLFGTTADFLQYFGLSSIDELPPYEVLVEETADKRILKD